MASFDSRQSFTPMQTQYPPIPYANMGPQTLPNAMQHPSSAYRGYAEMQTPRQSQPTHQPQIYTAVYSSVAVYEMEVHGIAVMKRRSDSWLNATQILKVAGVDKGKRTKILEKEILTGQHEKVQGGYGRYQGTWINYQRGREFCRQYDVEDILGPLLDYDMASDGTGASGQVDTPTKEQAMAANRKRFYNSGMDNRMNGQTSTNTFFQNISPTASNALAAMNKAARFDSPLPRPGSAQRRPPGVLHRQSSQQMQSQDSGYLGGSQQSLHSFTSEQGPELNGPSNAQYGSLGTPMYGRINGNTGEMQEPPRKRMRASSSQDMYGQLDPSLQDGPPTEPILASMQMQYVQDGESGPFSLSPLFSPSDKAGEEKRLALEDLFVDTSRTDFSTHTAILHLSGEDLDIPLDASANTALHWAATLARVPLMRLLISKGASIYRGNAAGQTPLMAAVQVNNSLDHSCFPDMLEILGPLIELRDATGRTVLHHIAVSSGIKGRSVSSRYYLESLLEFVVRQGSNPSSQQQSFDGTPNSRGKAIGLVRFMSEVVNVQDKSGNTALNLVARIGNRAIINQLDELGADFNIPNHTGFRPTDFGVFPRAQGAIQATSSSQPISSISQTKAPSQIDQIREEIFATTTSILTQTQSQYTSELSKSQSLLDHQTTALRSTATAHKAELDRLEILQTRAKARADRASKIQNLRRALAEQRQHHNHETMLANGDTHGQALNNGIRSPAVDPLPESCKIDPNRLPSSPSQSSASDVQRAYISALPPAPVLRARLAAFAANNAMLEARVAGLRGRSAELEGLYRRVVSLCTGVEEGRVEGLLEGLVAAVESEVEGDGKGGRVEGGRVREFLRKVEGVEG